MQVTRFWGKGEAQKRDHSGSRGPTRGMHNSAKTGPHAMADKLFGKITPKVDDEIA